MLSSVKPVAVDHPNEAGAGALSIRSVERAIDLLQILNARPVSTLAQLHADTGLPKPTLIRLLRTLEGKGLVAQSPHYGAYQLLGHVKSLSSGFHHEPMIVELANDLLVDLTKAEGWPIALAMFDIDAMVVRSSTIPFTSLSLLQSSLSMRLSMLGRAHGRTYLGHCEPHERDLIIEILKRNNEPENRLASEPRGLEALLLDVRARGYALRDQTIPSRSATIAVPVFDKGKIAATLGLTWIRAAMSQDEAVERYLPKMKRLAWQLEAALAEKANLVRMSA